MKTYARLIEELCEAAKIDVKAIEHHGHMMALYRTRNMLNPQLATRNEMEKHIEKLKKHGAVVSKYSGVKHPDADADRLLKTGISKGISSEYDAQPQYRHDTIRKSSKIRKEVGDFTGLDAYRKATGNIK